MIWAAVTFTVLLIVYVFALALCKAAARGDQQIIDRRPR